MPELRIPFHGTVPIAAAAARALGVLGTASGRLVELQTKAALMAASEASTRYVEALGAMWGEPVDANPPFARDGVRGLIEPMLAWTQVVAGVQAIALKAFVQASAAVAFPCSRVRHDPGDRRAEPRAESPSRRVNSVVIPFPDRRGKAAA